jgi:3-hydroxybutyryl-CoA dehydratase
VEKKMNELNGYDVEDLAPGMTGSFSKTITDADIVMFSGVSGDANPTHVDEEYASSTELGGRVAHGFITGSLISTTLASRMPGPGTIYLSQTMRFLDQVRIGDTVHAIVTVREIGERGHVTLDTVCRVGETDVLVGEALVKISSSKLREEKKKRAASA